MTDAAAPTLKLPGRVIQALLAGEQVVDLRRSGDGGPPPGAGRFWLVADPAADPALKPAYQRARELSLADEVAGPGRTRIDGWAELAGTASTVVDDKVKEALDGKTILALDPFDGQPLRMKRDGKDLLLYSIGANLRDDGGSPGASPYEGDLVFRVRGR